MLTEIKRPYEFLARWNAKTGLLQGAHVGFANTVLRDGVFLTEVVEPVQSVAVGLQLGYPLNDILQQLQIDALAERDRLTDEVASKESIIVALERNAVARDATIASQTQTIAARDAEIAALKARPAPVA